MVLEVLGGKGATGLRKVVDVFRELDMDGDGEVTKADFYERLQELGAEDFVTRHHSLLKEEIDRIFDEIDHNGNGRIGYDELKAMLRRNKHVKLTRSLRDGSVRFDVEARNRCALRADVSERRIEAADLREATLDEMRLAMMEGAGD